jgi:3-deoxy-7-phosphoheptulonate synthase
MIITMNETATEADVREVIQKLEASDFIPRVSQNGRVHIAALGKGKPETIETLKKVESIAKIERSEQPFTLASRQLKPERTVVSVGKFAKIGGEKAVVIAGPCSVESFEQTIQTARCVADGGALMLRGGAYKPRTSPYEFQGLGVEALKILRRAADETGLAVVTEVMSEADVETIGEYAEMFQVGARNMQNFALLRRLGKTNKPVLLKRGASATVKEWLLAAEYLLAGGNENVVLCERGIKTFETATRNTLDVAAVALVKELSHLPVIVDPSHATGIRSLVAPAARAGLAVGADGVIVEVHPQPESALSDGAQSLTFEGFAAMMKSLREIKELAARD